jgi:hypothetical protein
MTNKSQLLKIQSSNKKCRDVDMFVSLKKLNIEICLGFRDGRLFFTDGSWFKAIF